MPIERACVRPPLTLSVAAWPRRTGIAFAWISRPLPDGIRICVGGAATQVAIPSGRRPRPDENPLCVGKPPTQLAIPSEKPTQLQKSSGPVREIHAGRDSVRARGGTGRRGRPGRILRTCDCANGGLTEVWAQGPLAPPAAAHPDSRAPVTHQALKWLVTKYY